VIDFKGRDFGCFGLARGETTVLKRKAGASSRTPYVVFYGTKLTTKREKIKKKVRKK
jgi:hypothetical protein